MYSCNVCVFNKEDNLKIFCSSRETLGYIQILRVVTAGARASGRSAEDNFFVSYTSVLFESLSQACSTLVTII